MTELSTKSGLRTNKVLLWHETDNALLSPVFLSFFCQPYPKYWGIRSKKYFIDHQTANTIQLFVPIKRKFLRSIQAFSGEACDCRRMRPHTCKSV